MVDDDYGTEREHDEYSQNLTEVDVTVVEIRDISVLVEDANDREISIPISQIANWGVLLSDDVEEGDSVVMEIPTWLAEKEGLV